MRYSRQSIHHQRVSTTSHDTPVPPSRPSASHWPRGAHMSNRARRDLARQHGRRTWHAAHHQNRLGARVPAVPRGAPRHGTQGAQRPRDGCTLAGALARRLLPTARVATRSAAAAARSAEFGTPTSSATVMPMDMSRLRYLWGRGETHRPAPEPTGDRPARWSGEPRGERRALASRSTPESRRSLHISGRILTSSYRWHKLVAVNLANVAR